MATAGRWTFGLAAAAVGTALLLIGAGSGPASADVEELAVPDDSTSSTTGDDEFDFFRSFDVVSSQLKLSPSAFKLPLGWVPGAKGFGLENGGSIVIESSKQRISVVATPKASTLPAGAPPVGGFLFVADWDETDPSDESPELTVGFRVDDVTLVDLNRVFTLGSNVPVAIERSWVLFTEVPRDLTIDDLPQKVKDFFDVGKPNAALSKDTPLSLAPDTANLVAQIDLTQNKPLQQTIALAGVKNVDLLVRGTLASDVGSLFGDGETASLLELDLTATLDAKGDDPPEWLKGRQFDIRFGFDELEEPFIEIGDAVQTFVGDASNTFKRGARFDPSFFDGLDETVPLLLRFGLDGQLEVPFGIDMAEILGLGPDQLGLAFTLGATLDLTQDDPVTSLDIGFEFTGGVTTISMDVDTEPDGSVKAVFAVNNAGSFNQFANRLSALYGVDAPNLAPIGDLTLQDASVTIKQKGKASSVRVQSTVGVYDQPFGVPWLKLETLSFDATLSNQGTGKVIGDTPSLVGSLAAQVDVDETQWTVAIAVGGALKKDEVSLEGAITLSLGTGEALGIADAVAVISKQFPDQTLAVPDELSGISLRDIELGLVASVSGSSWEVAADAFAIATLDPLGDIAVYIRAGLAADEQGDVGLQFDVGVRPAAPIKLSSLVKIPGLSDKEGAADTSPELPAFAFVLTTQQIKSPAAELTPAGFDFYKGLHGCAPETVQPQPGESFADKVVGEPTDPNEPKKCIFSLELKPGVNLIANLAAFPAELDPLVRELWMDPDQGLQFLGRIPFPGSTPTTAVDLQLRMPRIVPPPEVDFLTGGQLAIGVKAGTSGLETYLEGEVDTRWRRSDPNPGSCDEIGGELLTGFDLVGQTMVESEYCYDRLRFKVKSAIALTTSKLTAKLSGAVISQDPNFGWQEPFGIPNITIGKLALALEVGISPAPVQVSFNGGFAGDIIVGDPTAGGKRFFGSAGAGFAIVPAPTPAGVTIVPSFIGVRGYVSAIGLTDVARLWQSLFPEVELPPGPALPLAEVQNAEFMLAVADNDDLCLTAGIFLAGELYVVDTLSEPGPVVVPPRDDDGCTRFGALVDSETCLSDDPDIGGRRDEGCFASFFGQISLAGVIADGRVGSLDFGAVKFDDAQLTFKLSLQEQSLIVRGGATIIDPALFDGEVAVKLGLFDLDFYGKVQAFDAFDAEVSGGYAVKLEDGFPPPIETNLRVVLGADFDKVIVDPVVDGINEVRNVVVGVEQTWDALVRGDYAAIFDVREFETTLGIELSPWLDDVLTAAETAFGDGGQDGQDALAALLETDITTDAYCGLGLLNTFGVTGECIGIDLNTYEPTCLIGTISEDKKTCSFSYQNLLDGLSTLLTDGIAQLLPIDFAQLPSLSTFLEEIVGGLEQVELFDLECAEFDYQTNATGAVVDLRGKLTLLGTTYGLELQWNMANGLEGVDKLLRQVWTQIFHEPATVQCSPLAIPPGISPASFETVDVAVTPTVVDEGGTVEAFVTFGSDPGTSVSIDWGDGDAPVPMDGTGAIRTASHLYRDDPRVPGNRYDVNVYVDGVAVGTTTVTVNNVAPTVTAQLDATTVVEGDMVELSIAATDPGDPDPLLAVVTWGDGTSTVVGLPTAPLMHTYVDDPPTGVAGADLTVRVLVLDGDGGIGRATMPLRLENDIPIATSLSPSGPVVEGAPAAFTVAFDDDGLVDAHTVEVDWGDGLSSTVDLAEGQRELELIHTWLDDNPSGTPSDDYDVAVTVTDDDSGTTTRRFEVPVANVAPSDLQLEIENASAEYGIVVVDGSFVDPGTVDAHRVVVDWGDDAIADTEIDLDGERNFTAAQRYGDDGTFTITVTVTDDDTGQVLTAGTTTVVNVDPTVAISRFGSEFIGGISTFLLQYGEDLTLDGRGADRGSDDLELTWDFDGRTGTMPSATVTSFVPTQGNTADADPSPSVEPRFGSALARHSRTVTYQRGCFYEITLAGSDDDHGAAQPDSVAAIMFGDRTIVRGPGYYYEQYAELGGNLTSTEQRECDVLIAEHLSDVFGERIVLARDNPSDAFAAATAVLDAGASDPLARFDRQLLTTWLNVAGGTLELDSLVDADGDGSADTELWDLLRDYESAPSTATRKDLNRMATLLESINGGS